MKFSIFFEMQIADPTRASEAQTFRDCVEQAVLADELGYHSVWEVEHHGLYEYSHSSAPEVFLAFVAARTRRIRLGHGVTLLPHRYNHPIRIAERIATLDILSGGRVSWGSGKSSSLVEQVAFETDLKTLHDQWLRRAAAAARPVGRQKNDWFACTPATLVLDDDLEACRHGLRGARFFSEAMARYYLSGTRPLGRLDVPRGFLGDVEIAAARGARNAAGSSVGVIVGDPAAARESVARFVDAGVDELLLVMQLGTVPHELVLRSMRTFAEKVMPHF